MIRGDFGLAGVSTESTRQEGHNTRTKRVETTMERKLDTSRACPVVLQRGSTIGGAREGRWRGRTVACEVGLGFLDGLLLPLGPPLYLQGRCGAVSQARRKHSERTLTTSQA